MDRNFVKGAVVGALLALVISSAFVYAIWPRPVQRKSELQLIQEKGIIRVGTDAAYPPYEWIDMKTGQVVGYEPDLVQIIADRLGVKIEWVVMDYSAVIASLKEGRIDLIASSMGYRADREREMGLTRFHYYEYSAVVFHKDSNVVMKEFEDLAKYTVGVQSGTTQEKTIRDKLIARGLMKESQLVLYPKFDLPIMDCAVKKIDAVFIGEPVAISFSKEYPIKTVFRIKLVPGKVLAVNKAATELLTEINIIIADLEFTGELRKLYLKYDLALPE